MKRRDVGDEFRIEFEPEEVKVATIMTGLTLSEKLNIVKPGTALLLTRNEIEVLAYAVYLFLEKSSANLQQADDPAPEVTP